jgi:hypothetical protein
MAKKLPYVLMSENVEPFTDVEEPSEILKLSWTTYSQILEKYYS